MKTFEKEGFPRQNLPKRHSRQSCGLEAYVLQDEVIKEYLGPCVDVLLRLKTPTILKFKSTITEMKTSLKGLSSGLGG